MLSRFYPAGSFLVASLADAWIEIKSIITLRFDFIVASLADAWIEMLSLLKMAVLTSVASLADAWIEMFKEVLYILKIVSRIPRGCVD